MKLLDISRPISGAALVYPGDPCVRTQVICESPFRLTALEITTHVLTHLDAPRHFFPEGPDVAGLPLERFTGEARVIEVSGDAVLPAHVPNPCRGLSLLFKTRHSGAWSPVYDTGHVYVSHEAAACMAAGAANLAGIDYLSVDPFGDESYRAHRTLLGAGVLILEGLDLSAAAPGRYTLFALPLKLDDADGSPVRAVLAPIE